MEKESDVTNEMVVKLYSGLLNHAYDYFKHMTTLNTGSLLIIIGLLKGVFKKPEGICVVVISICFFTISLVCALVTLGLLLKIETIPLRMYSNSLKENEGEGGQEEEKIKEYKDNHQKELDSLTKKGKIIEYITMSTFFAGIAMFLIFVFLNFVD